MDLNHIPECHIVTIAHDDAVLLAVILKRWHWGMFFEGEQAADPWYTRAVPVIDRIEAIATWTDLGTLDSDEAEELGRLRGAIRREYGQNYRTLGHPLKRRGRIISAADGLFKHDYRWINDLGNKFFQRPIWKHFIATAKDEA